MGQFSCPKRDGNRVPAKRLRLLRDVRTRRGRCPHRPARRREKGPAFCGAGQNARLAAKLTGWKIDIKPVSAPSDEEPEDEEDVLLDDGAETEE